MSDQDDGKANGGRSQGQQARARSTVEWITLGISAAIVAGLLGLIVLLYLQEGDQPVVIEVAPQWQALRQEGELYYLPVEVKNSGGQTASSVRVAVSLTGSQGQAETGEFSVDFLAGGATANAVVTFRQEPTRENIRTNVSYLEP